MVPTRSEGLSSETSTRPGTGRKMVWRVEVRITAERVLRVASTSVAPPSSVSSSSSPVCVFFVWSDCGS